MNATLLGLVCALTLGCGGRTHGVETGGETGFLEACGSDADCQSGLCACGVCSRTCEEVTDCNDSRAACVSGAAACDGESRAVCLQKQASSDDASVGFQTTGQPTSPGSEDCHGPGHYEAGKGGEYRPCCEGLTEVSQLGAAEGDDGPVCVELPLRIYACVEGTCGDGVCEVGEDVRCGCVDDCPDAAWGDDPGPAPTATGSPSVIDDGTDCNGLDCGGISSELVLRDASAGNVDVRLEVEGTFCPPNIFGSAITLHNAASGTLVPSGRTFGEVHLCEGECPSTPPPVNPVADTDAFTWDGRVTVADATEVCEDGNSKPCQTAPRYAPPGRYLARACSYCSEQGEVCAEQEFDYPGTDEVVILMNNPWSPTSGDTNPSPDSISSNPASTTFSVDVEFDAGFIDASVDASSL